MTTTLHCARCGAPLDDATGQPAACPQCGTATTPPVTILPPPPQLFTPQEPVEAMATLAYGELQHAAIYLGMARTLRGMGIGQLVTGVIWIALGVYFWFKSQGALTPSSSYNLGVSVIFLLTGLWLIGSGIWFVATSSETAMQVAGVSMIVIGGIFALYSILVAIILIFYGIEVLRRRKRYGPLMTSKPSETMRQQAGVLLDTLLKAKRKKSPDIIEFSSSTATARRLWRGLLQDNLLVLIALDSRIIRRHIADVFFLPPSGLAIDISRREVWGTWLKGTFIVGEQKVTGTIPRECYERYQAWQARHGLTV